MAITGPASYPPTMSLFAGHIEEANNVLPQPVVLVLPTFKTTMTLAQFTALRDSIVAQGNTIQSRLTAVQIVRGNIKLKKEQLIKWINMFNSRLDSDFQGTEYYDSRPLAPSLNDGQAVFNEPLRATLSLWEQINEGPAPFGVTLPLTLGDGTDFGSFASTVSSLQFLFNEEGRKEGYVKVARSRRNRMQDRAYEAMLVYREGAANRFVNFPELIDSLPRLTPLPGHTPEAVNASVVFEAPDSFKVVYSASTDATLESYQLRGHVGDDYDPDLAVVLGTNQPGDPREFVKTFGLTQPGARVVLKVYVILTTGNEAGSPAMSVQRPLAAAA